MDYTKLAENIKQHIAPNPSDHVPYLDLLSVCRQLEHDDFTMAHALKNRRKPGHTEVFFLCGARPVKWLLGAHLTEL
ncbi:MAG TPA: hypothetical protein DIU32_05245 [Oscillibacter sp.]|jgi:hypothetical protein|nr:hypothetical protein [Oscillibacter sp.]